MPLSGDAGRKSRPISLTTSTLSVDKAKTLLNDPNQGRKMKSSVYDTWARSFWGKKQYDKGLTIYRQGLKKLPGNALLMQNAVYVWNLKGMLHIKAKDWGKAVATYKAALKEFPKSGTLKNNLRFCEQQKKRAAKKKP